MVLRQARIGSIPDLKRLSHSACEVLESCPMRFLFEYRMKLEYEPTTADYAETGRIVHDVIPLSYPGMHEIETSKDPISLIWSSVANAMKLNLEKPKTDKAKEDSILCLSNFTKFMENRYAYGHMTNTLNNFLPVKYEQYMLTRIGGILFSGKIDAIFKDLKFWLVDWKTSSTTKIGEAEIRQAIRYVLLYKEFTGIQVEDFFVINLRKEVDLEKCRIAVTDEMLKEGEERLKELWKLGSGDIFEKKKEYTSCMFCNYKLTCARSPDVVSIRDKLEGWF